MFDGMSFTVGLSALLNMTLTLAMIIIAWWSLQVFKFDLFIRNVHSTQAKLFHVLLAVALGYLVADFLIQYMDWTRMLPLLFS